MLDQKRDEEHFAVLHKYYQLPAISYFVLLVRCFFRICQVIVRDMLVKFMYVANIGKTIIKAALLNILQGVLVLKGKRKTIRLTSFFVSKMTGLLNQQPRENRFSTDLYVTH